MTAARALVALLLASAASLVQAFGGVVTHVTDGDTVWVAPDDAQHKPVKLRLAGLDAPERCQPWGAQAGEALAARVLHRRVEVSTRAVDMHGRAIGSLSLDGDDVGAWLVEQGHAWSQRWQRNPGPYAAQERTARSERRGLFGNGAAITPRDFRRSHGPCP